MTDYTALVEPRLGNTMGRWISFSSACRPAGMVNLSPDTRINGDWRCGYNLADTEILGFSHIHDWQVGGILVMPVVGDVAATDGPDSFKSPFSRDTEICKPGYHRVHLDRYDITAELTSTVRVGVHRYAFPKNEPAAVLIDLASQCGPCEMGPATLTQLESRRLQGSVINKPTVRKPKDLTVYFAIEFDHDVTLGVFAPDAVRARIEIGTLSAPLLMKVGISYTSADAAWANLRAETDGKSFDDIREESRTEWNRLLSRINVEGGTDEQRGRFYTDLFTALVGRRTCSDHGGTYIDNTGPQPVVRQIPLDDSGKPLYRHFNSDAFWGAQWSLVPLWAIAYPEMADEFCRCFMDMHDNGGLIPRGPSSGNYTFVMTSAQSTPLFAAALNNGLYKPADVERVYQAVRKNHFPGGLMSKAGYEHNTCVGGGIEDYIALGYIPEDLPKAGFHTNGAGQTVEHSWNDWCLAQLARGLSRSDDAELFEKRSKNYRNLFDRNEGFCRPRNRDDSWVEGFTPWNRHGWTEANAWTFTFHVPHDLDGLADCFGDQAKMLARLEEAFEKTEERGFFVEHEKHEHIPLDYGNEPALACAHLFHLAGQPHRTQYWVRRVLEKLKSGNQPTDHWGGDEDQGIMGAWNVLVSIGLFSARGACESPARYQVTSPLFDKVTIHLNRDYFPGDTFTITTRGNGAGEMRYIHDARIDNQRLSVDLEIDHTQITQGGTLFLDLTENANDALKPQVSGERSEPAPYKIWGKELEAGALQQMHNATRLKVAVRGALMPDAHQGYGLPIGGVLATDNSVIPYAVGVDIACRMKISVYDIPADKLKRLHQDLQNALKKETVFGTGAGHLRPLQHDVLDEDWTVSPMTRKYFDKARTQLGTSGSGNHFVEFGILTLDKPDLGLQPGEYLALLSHSGSRGTGAQVADYYSKLAMKKHPELPKELKYLAWLDLDSADGQEYWAAMELMGKYASANHALIHKKVAAAIGGHVIAGVENHHNFAWKEMHDDREVVVHRKGATPAGQGVLGVIPGSMAAPGFVVRGRGNEASLLSASHGAGRRMSRTQAKNTFRWAHYKKLFEEQGITLMSAGIDEAPGAYKDIHEVMAQQSDLVDIVARFDPKIVRMADAGEKPED